MKTEIIDACCKDCVMNSPCVFTSLLDGDKSEECSRIKAFLKGVEYANNKIHAPLLREIVMQEVNRILNGESTTWQEKKNQLADYIIKS